MPRDRKPINCPLCDGVANKMWFSHLETRDNREYAVFVVECWSGSLNRASKRHYFKTSIRMSKKTEIDQFIELEKRINELEAELEELRKKTGVENYAA